MRISGVLKSLSKVLKFSKDEIKYKSLTKESLLAQIEDAKWSLNIINSTLFTFSPKQLDQMWKISVDAVKMNVSLHKALGKNIVGLHSFILKGLKGKARNLGPMGSMRWTNKIMLKLMNDIGDNVDSILTDKGAIEINKTQISHGLFIGSLESAKMYSKFVSYFVALTSHIGNFDSNQELPPKYMLDYLAKNSEYFVSLLNQLCNISGKYSIINDITNIKSHGLDFKFSSTNSSGATQSSKLVSDVLGVENIFLTVFDIALRPIALIGETYVDMRNQHYTDIKNHKKWLESHTAILKMDLEDIDKNSPEYVKTEKMIQYYENQIAEYDKKLDKYYNE